ncbi:MAG: lipopolysaccharide biosynthesis protein [Steroidobacteraceae bacterium]
MSAPEAVASPVRVGLFRQFSTTVVDQVVLSGANFIVGLLLIRRTSDADYGMFVLVQSAITLLISGQMAWLSSPLAVLAPGKTPALRRLMVGAVESSQRRFLRRASAVALVVPVLGYFLHYWTGLESLVVVLGIGACWTALQREYLRGVLLVYGRPQAMLRADLVNVAVLLTGALIAVYGPKPAVLWAVVALIASALAGETVARRSLAKDPGLPRGDPSPFWKEMRPLAVWATVGALTYWIYNQSYNYVLASRIDLTAVADVNAARLLLMPTIVLTVGVKTLLVPTAASWLAESSVGRLIRRLLLFATGIALIDVVYCIVLWIFRDLLSHDLLHKTIGNRDLLLILWAALSLIALYRDLLQTGLFALRKFRPLAGVTAVSAAASLTIMWLGIKTWGPAAALIGQVAGETINLVGVVVLLAMASRSERANRPDTRR